MRLKTFALLIALMLGIGTVFAETNYRVTSSSRLNVRESPSISGAIFGTFQSGQEIEVISINSNCPIRSLG